MPERDRAALRECLAELLISDNGGRCPRASTRALGQRAAEFLGRRKRRSPEKALQRGPATKRVRAAETDNSLLRFINARVNIQP